MKLDEDFVARSAAKWHLKVSGLALLLVFAATLVNWVLGLIVFFVALGTVVKLHIVLGEQVHERVSPAYSEGHPLVNLPPEMGGPENDIDFDQPTYTFEDDSQTGMWYNEGGK